MPDAPISEVSTMPVQSDSRDDVEPAVETSQAPSRAHTARPRPALSFSSRDLTSGAITPAVRTAGATIAGAITD